MLNFMFKCSELASNLKTNHRLRVKKAKNYFRQFLCSIQGGQKKSLWCDLEENCLRNSKICFDGVFLSVYSQEVRAF